MIITPIYIICKELSAHPVYMHKHRDKGRPVAQAGLFSYVELILIFLQCVQFSVNNGLVYRRMHWSNTTDCNRMMQWVDEERASTKGTRKWKCVGGKYPAMDGNMKLVSIILSRSNASTVRPVKYFASAGISVHLTTSREYSPVIFFIT